MGLIVLRIKNYEIQNSKRQQFQIPMQLRRWRVEILPLVRLWSRQHIEKRTGHRPRIPSFPLHTRTHPTFTIK